jgi:hypothetical protein
MYAKHSVLSTERLKYRFVIGGLFWLGARKTNIFELVMIPGILSILDCLINVTYRVQNISYSRIIKARAENYFLHHKYIRKFI